MILSELKPHMTHTNCFTRLVVAQAIAKKNAEKYSKKHYDEAGKMLKIARALGEVKFAGNLIRSCYYEFIKEQE